MHSEKRILGSIGKNNQRRLLNLFFLYKNHNGRKPTSKTRLTQKFWRIPQSFPEKNNPIFGSGKKWGKKSSYLGKNWENLGKIWENNPIFQSKTIFLHLGKIATLKVCHIFAEKKTPRRFAKLQIELWKIKVVPYCWWLKILHHLGCMTP